MAVKKIFITATGAGTFTIPPDWTDVNTIEVIGGGGGGQTAAGAAASGGSGGQYRILSNVAGLSGSIDLAVGAGGGAGAAGGNTWWNSTTFLGAAFSAEGGKAGAGGTSKTGGSAGVGGTGNNGGPSGAGGSAATGGGGGGAAGPGGVGGTGGPGDNTSTGQDWGGGGGSGAGASTGGGTGGTGTANVAAGGTNADGGGPGGASGQGAGVTPAVGTGVWTSTHLPDTTTVSVVTKSPGGGGGGGGSGSGGGGAATGANCHGGGGGGAGNGTAGAGGAGLIVITYTTAPETVTEDKYHRPLSEPTRRLGLLPAIVAGALSYSNYVAPTTGISYASTQAIVPYERALLYQSLFQPVPIVTAAAAPDVALASSDQIVPYKRTLLYQSVAKPPFTPAETDLRWFAPLSQPTRRPVSNQPAALTFAPLPVTVAAYRWQQPLAEPVRRKPHYEYPANFFHANPITVAAYQWQQPLSVPTRSKPTVYPDALSWSTFTPTAATGTGDIDFSSSVAGVPYARTFLYPSSTQPVLVETVETITVDKWFAALSQPTLRKPTVHPPATALDPNPVTVAAYRWQQPLSEPTRRKPHYEYPAYFSQPFPLTVEAYRWWRPLAEPTRREQRTQPDALSWSTFTPPSSEVVTVDKWFAAFAEQSRIRLGLAAHQQQWLALHPLPITVAAFRWHVPLSEPVRIRRAADFPALTLYPLPVTVDGYRWLRPFAEPTRREIRVQPAWSTFTPPSTEDVTVDKWFAPLHVPMLGIWTPTRMDFTWFPPSGEPGPTPPTGVQKDGDPDYWKLPWFHLDDETFHHKLRRKAITALEEAVDAAKAAEPAKAKRAARKAAKSLREYGKAAGALLSDDVVAELGQTAAALNYAASQWQRDDLIERVSTARMALLAFEAAQQDEEDALIALMVAD